VERKALLPQLLAAKHGRRRQAICALMEAVFITTTEGLANRQTASAITTALMGSQYGSKHQPAGWLPTAARQTAYGSVRAIYPCRMRRMSVSERRKQRRHDSSDAGRPTGVGLMLKASRRRLPIPLLHSLEGMASGFFD